MIVTFADQGTEDIFNGKDTKAARRALPQKLHRVAVRKLDWLNRARALEDLKAPPSNHLEALKGDLEGYWSIRVNDQYRIIFQWREGNAYRVKITDYH